MELFEYDFKDNQHDFKEWMRDSSDGLEYLTDGRKALSTYISNIDDIVEEMDKVVPEAKRCCRARVYEHGVVLFFQDGVENYQWNEDEPVESYAIIFDTGEIHYVIRSYGNSTTANREKYEELVDRLGEKVEYVAEDSGLNEKKREQLNSEIKRLKEAKVRTVLGNIQDQLEAEKENSELSEEQKSIIEMADYLNKKENNLVTTDYLRMVLRTKFDKQKEEDKGTIDLAISRHLSYTGQVFNENKVIVEIQKQQPKKKKKKSA